MNGFDKIRELFDDLLAPFQELADAIRSLFLYDTSDSLTTLDFQMKVAKKHQKDYKKHIDDKYKLQYKQSSFVKVTPRNLPYQRRNY